MNKKDGVQQVDHYVGRPNFITRRYNMRLPLLTLGVLVSNFVFAQGLLPEDALRFSPATLSLGEVSIEAHTTGSWLCNDADETIHLSLENLGSKLLPQLSEADIEGGDSLWISFDVVGGTDLDLTEILLAHSIQVAGLPRLEVSAEPRLSDSRWNSAANLWGDELLDALESIVDGHTAYSYTNARHHMFGGHDNEGGQVQCVYTGEWLATNDTPDHTVMNCEHTWPQSMGATDDAKTDMHHLFPTMSGSNSVRGNLPFGVVENANWEEGGSQRGSDEDGVSVFEPRDVHKGDCARAMFYFAMRWGNRQSFLNYQEDILRDWCITDPVSDKELLRNQAIDDLQHNMSPLVENPAWLDRFASLAGNATPSPTRELLLPSASIQMVAATGENMILQIPLLNAGNSPLLIGYTQIDPTENTGFTIVDAPTQIPANSLEWIELHYTAGEAESLALLRISSNADNGFIHEIQLTGTSTDTDLDEAMTLPSSPIFHAAYPNPFNPSTQLHYTLPQAADVDLAVYNLQGQQVAQLVQGQLRAGEHMTCFHGNTLSSGLYFARLQVEGQLVGTERLLLLE
jgi:deoxyribonuclease I